MKKIAFILVATFSVISFLHAQKSEVLINDGAAVHGYDVVAYFTDSKPMKGDKQFLYQWNNATWYFASKEHLDAFKTNPEKYAPQYGGYCAYGLCKNHKSDTDPNAWKIENGKLYLYYNKDVKMLWEKSAMDNIMMANENWQGMKDKE